MATAQGHTMQKPPTDTFDSRNFAPDKRLSAFQAMTASIYEVEALGNREDFVLEAVGYHVKGLMFTDFKCGGARFKRTRRHLKGEDKDFLVLHAQLSGEEILHMEHGIIRLLPGNIYLRDWAYRFDAQTTGMHIRGVVIPRIGLTFSGQFAPHNPILSWPMTEPKGRLLWTLWSQLFDQLEQVDLGTAECLAQGFIGLLNGINTGSTPGQQPGKTKLRALELYLQARLRGDVGVEDICRHFHISRATVFRLFKEHGGLHSYVDRLRLERCYAELRSADPCRTTVGEVAAGWGYADPKSFNRKFRDQFGMPPSRVLGAGFDWKSRENGQHRPDAEYANLFRNFKRWLADASGMQKEELNR